MTEETIQLAICAVYNLFILSLSVVLVALYGWSAWWILGAVACFASPKNCFKDSE
jgi:hypothetical protein